MKTLKCAIVEDSLTQRKLLEQSIDHHKSLTLLFSFGNGKEALKEINESKIDILFLDIEMPIMNGFQFLEGLTIKPQVIIISQHPKYALEAFDFNVTDYLLKPFNKIRFTAAVQKAIDKKMALEKISPESKMVIKHNLKQVELNIHNVLWVEAHGDYVKVVTDERNYVILSTMNSFFEKLNSEKFIRIHKSYIINLKVVDRYNHEFIEIKNKKIPISRTKLEELDRLLNCLD